MKRLIILLLITYNLIFSQRWEDSKVKIDDDTYIEYSPTKRYNILATNHVGNLYIGMSTPYLCDSKGNTLMYLSKLSINSELDDLQNSSGNYRIIQMLNGRTFKDIDASYGVNDIIVLPQPQSTCNYYVLQSEVGLYNGIDNDSVIRGFQYHIINMKGDNGKGEVISKNNKLKDSTCSAIGAIPSKDKKAYWIFSITYPELCLEQYKLTKDGVKKTQNSYCYLDHIDVGKLFFQNHRYTHGLPYVEMKMSPTNDKFAIAGTEQDYYKVKLFKFDNETGKIEFDYELKNSDNFKYGGLNRITFTEDGKYLYFGYSIYDLSKNSPEEVQASEYVIKETIWGIDLNPYNEVCALVQSKEYNNTLEYVIFDYDGTNLNIERIQHETLYNSFSIIYHNTFPLHPYEYLNNLNTTITLNIDGQTKYCSGETVFISTSYEPEFEEVTHYWYDKDSNIVGVKDLIIEDVKKEHEGWYYYEISAECRVNKKRDSVYIEIQELEPKITTSQNNFCYGDSATLSLDKDYESIIWNTGESTKDIIVKESGVYSATVTQGECTNDTNIVINVNPLPTLDIEAPKGTILCDGGSIILEAKVPANTKITWNDGTKLAKRTVSISGTYTLTAEDIKTGCKNTKSIVVTDIENLKAEIQGDPTFCDGESTTLTIQPQGKSYLWNTGETTQSIVVNESGLFSATITTDTDCKIDAEIEVIKNPLPTFQILGETIICNNSTIIYPDKDFKFYEWSNGETSKSITIDKTGNYNLTVTDINGCKATQSIEITESTPEINLSNRNIDFGELLFGDTKSENITTDRDIILFKNSNIFDFNYSNNNINISFNPKDIGEFEDTLIIESIGDCKALDTIYIKGICKAEILAKVSNSKGYPGDLVNNTVNLELMQNIPLPKDFNYEIDIQINEDAIQIQDATTFNYKNNKLEINIADYINKTQYDEEVKEINSKIMLAKNLENELQITKFETDNPYLIPIRQHGNIKIYEVCLYEARLIENYNEALIKQITQTKIKLTTYFAGDYEIEITDISGKTIYQKTNTTTDNEEINFNYNLTNGTYIIKINEPGKTQTRKIVFVE